MPTPNSIHRFSRKEIAQGSNNDICVHVVIIIFLRHCFKWIMNMKYQPCITLMIPKENKPLKICELNNTSYSFIGKIITLLCWEETATAIKPNNSVLFYVIPHKIRKLYCLFRFWQLHDFQYLGALLFVTLNSFQNTCQILNVIVQCLMQNCQALQNWLCKCTISLTSLSGFIITLMTLVLTMG